MRATLILASIVIALVASGAASPRKVIVLPLDGNAPAGQRSKLNAAIVKLTKKNVTGDVTAGDTTFAETAAAVGCDPQQAACAQTVLSTLSVDELVYGTATKDGKSTTIVIKRVRKGADPKSETTTIGATDSADKAEPGLEPVFKESEPVTPPQGSGSEGSAVVGSGSDLGSGSGSAVAPGPRPRPGHGISFLDTTDRKLGVALAGAGVIFIAIGVSFWASEAGIQRDIDNHATNTLADFNALKTLEEKAAGKALWGDITFIAGLGMAGAAGYLFYRDSKHRGATVTPAPVESGTGMTLVYGGRW